MPADKTVQLTVTLAAAVRHGDDISVIQVAVISHFHQPGAESDLILCRERHELLRGRAVRHGFCQGFNLVSGQFPQKPVARNAALGKHDDLGAGLLCLRNETANLLEISRFIASGMLELHRGDSYFTHPILSPFTVTKVCISS